MVRARALRPSIIGMMSWRFFSLLALTLCLGLPYQLEAFVTRSTGCHHNGTWYGDKSMVPTTEKCLSCFCNKKTLVCRLKVCPEMPMPPPRGCVVVQKKNTCCPYLSCARLDAFYRIPTSSRIIAYLDHYERESIDRVVNENVLQRRSDDSEVDLYVCVKNGTVYKSGSAMSSSNLCTYCYCIGGAEKCVKPKCMLPVEGCKPIFVDSTCCPVRYDCSTKTSGKSSQETRYRKTSNKHFLRMSQRLQRNRGCTIGKQFYVEGQKMKSDLDKPCDICFCIRGTRRCAPKKCAPSLKNCMPVVPKGQCCPSSYDCGSQRDYRRSHSSRQFNLFSLLFGNEDGKVNGTEIAVQYPHDRHPTAETTKHEIQSSALSGTSPKSIFDTIREGLEFIDTNNQILSDDIDTVALPTTERPSSTTTKTSLTTEISFFDLLLGPSEPTGGTAAEFEESPPEEKTTTSYESLSWVDLLLGSEEEGNKNDFDTTQSTSDKLEYTEATTDFHNALGTTNIDRLGDDFDDFSGSGEIQVGMEEEQILPESTLKYEDITTDLTKSTQKPIKISSTKVPTKQPVVMDVPTAKIKGPIRDTTGTKHTKNQTALLGTNYKVKEKFDKTDSIVIENSQISPSVATVRPESNGLVSALIDGITGILKSEKQNVTSTKGQVKVTTPKPLLGSFTLPTPKPLPHFKPLPTNIRINSKIANLTLEPTMFVTTKNTQNITFKPLSTIPKMTLTTKIPSTTTSTKSTTAKPTKTTKPVYVKTNPSILEAEPLDTNTEPTLPPSLPNLKIIPFLPTDAVQADHNKLLYEYYHSISKQKPAQSTGSTIAPPVVVDGHWDLIHMTPNKNAKGDYDIYDEGGAYPSITEQHHSYPDLEDGSKAEYIYKFNVEGPTSSVSSTAGKMDGTAASAAFVKFDFGNSGSEPHGFSPPTKTEGGFVPKEPNASETAELYQVTPHIIDITTSEPIRESTTKPIEITTPDPFKDVIRTEPPPDLASLIEDKEKILSIGLLSESDVVVHITTEWPKILNSNTTEAPVGKFANQLNKTNAFDELPTEDKSKIESFLNMLFQDEATGSQHSLISATTTTTVPPFKALPLNAIKNIPANFTRTGSGAPITSTQKTTLQRSTTLAPTIKTTTTIKSTRKPTFRIKSKPRTTIRTTATTTTTTSKPATTQNNQKATKTKHSLVKASATMTTSTKRTPNKSPHTTTTTAKPVLMAPFDKLPFMDASFEVRLNHSSHQPSAAFSTHKPTDNFLGLVHYKNSLNKIKGLEPTVEKSTTQNQLEKLSSQSSSSSSASTATTKTITTSEMSSNQVQPQHTASNSLIDPNGVLKLAGCNIYGRMYRVGRIILELSSPCLECKCTEVGVKCGPLDC